MLSCDTARPRISRFLDNDLDARAAGALAQHLNGCVACRHEYDNLRAVRAALGILPLPQSRAERDAVRERVFARLERTASLAPSPAARRASRRLVWGPAAATLAAAAFLGAAYLVPFRLAAPANVAGSLETENTVVPLPAPAEMSLLYRLNDAHGGGLSGDDSLARRDTTAEAHAALLEATQAALAENL